MESTVFALLHRNIEEQKEDIKEYLASGGAKNYDEYCRAHGQYVALDRMTDNLKELEKRFIAD
jgi:hypothetical protein